MATIDQSVQAAADAGKLKLAVIIEITALDNWDIAGLLAIDNRASNGKFYVLGELDLARLAEAAADTKAIAIHDDATLIGIFA